MKNDRPFSVHGMTFPSLGAALDYANRLVAEGQAPMSIFLEDVEIGTHDPRMTEDDWEQNMKAKRGDA